MDKEMAVAVVAKVSVVMAVVVAMAVGKKK